MAAVVITILLSTAVGVWAEERYGGRAGSAARRALLILLYAVLPPVTFLNLARANLDFDHGAGIALAYVAMMGTLSLAWAAGTRVLRLSRPATGSRSSRSATSR